MFTYAITRQPGVNFANGLTQADLGRPSYSLISLQHAAYVDTLKGLGLTVTEMEPLRDYPDAYFIEDPALVTPDVAILTIPGAPSRQGEQNSLAPVLQLYRELVHIQPPGTVDGGDILMAGNEIFVGLSARTNSNGAQQLSEILNKHGYRLTPIAIEGGLHLKSDVNYIGDNTLLLTRGFAQLAEFDRYDKIVLKDEESYAANTLLINGCLITPKGFPDTHKKIEQTGYDVVELDVSEMQKMDGGLTCLSLRF